MKQLPLNERIKNGEELTNKEYLNILKHYRNEFAYDIARHNVSDFKKYLAELLIFGSVGKSFEADAVVDGTCCLIGTYPLFKTFYQNVYDDSFTCSKRLCHYNTLNFVREVDEVRRFEGLTTSLIDHLGRYVHEGYNDGLKEDIEENIQSLNESKDKIFTIRKKFIFDI